MLRRPPGPTRTDTLFPYTTLFRSAQYRPLAGGRGRPVVASAPGCAERRLAPFHRGARGRRRAEPRAGGYDAFARASVHRAVHRGRGAICRPALLLGASGALPDRRGGGRRDRKGVV